MDFIIDTKKKSNFSSISKVYQLDIFKSLLIRYFQDNFKILTLPWVKNTQMVLMMNVLYLFWK